MRCEHDNGVRPPRKKATSSAMKWKEHGGGGDEAGLSAKEAARKPAALHAEQKAIVFSCQAKQ